MCVHFCVHLFCAASCVINDGDKWHRPMGPNPGQKTTTGQKTTRTKRHQAGFSLEKS